MYCQVLFLFACKRDRTISSLLPRDSSRAGFLGDVTQRSKETRQDDQRISGPGGPIQSGGAELECLFSSLSVCIVCRSSPSKMTDGNTSPFAGSL